MGSIPRLLVVEADRDILRLITEFFALEGCQVSAVPTLEEAFEVVEAATFHLVVAGLESRSREEAQHLLAALVERCKPTPVGAISGWLSDADVSQLAGLAFAAPRSAEPEALLARVAGCLEALAREAPAPQRQVALAYFQALASRDWAGLAGLCSPGFEYRFCGLSGQERVVRGLEAFLDYGQQNCVRYPELQISDVVTFPTAGGVVTRYLSRWVPGPGRPRVSLAGAAGFQFAGARLRQVSVCFNDLRLRAVSGLPAPSRLA